MSVKQRIQKFEIDEETADLRGIIQASVSAGTKPTKQRPRSQAFELFETQGIVIGPVRICLGFIDLFLHKSH